MEACYCYNLLEMGKSWEIHSLQISDPLSKTEVDLQVMLPIITSFPIEGGESSQIARVFRGYRQVALRQHLLAILGGFILCPSAFQNKIRSELDDLLMTTLLLVDSFALSFVFFFLKS